MSIFDQDCQEVKSQHDQDSTFDVISVLQLCMRRVHLNKKVYLRVDDKLVPLNTIRFKDDIIIMAHTKEDHNCLTCGPNEIKENDM